MTTRPLLTVPGPVQIHLSALKDDLIVDLSAIREGKRGINSEVRLSGVAFCIENVKVVSLANRETERV